LLDISATCGVVMFQWMRLLTLAAILVGSTCRAADEPRAIVDKAIQAVGGRAALERARAVHAKAKGTLYEKGIAQDADSARFTAEMFKELPDRYKIIFVADLNGPLMYLTQALNGDQAWAKLNDENDQVDLQDMKADAYVDYVTTLLPLVKESSYTLSALEATKVGDRPALGVKVGTPGKPDVSLYFDPESGLLVQVRYRRRDPTTKKEVAYEETLSDYRSAGTPPAPSDADIEALRMAKLPTEGPALLAFLRRQTLDEPRRQRIQDLIRKLGDASFDVRDKAKNELQAEGPAAASLLAQAANNPDPEVANQVKECLEKIGKAPESGLLKTVVRVIAHKSPGGTTQALLDYLASAPDEAVRYEVQSALAALAMRDGKPDPVLEAALQDKDGRRRSAAAAALGRRDAADREAPPPGRQLYLPALKEAWKGVKYRDGKKWMEWELTEVQYFGKLDDHIFAKGAPETPPPPPPPADKSRGGG
jgi:hypothetical protein